MVQCGERKIPRFRGQTSTQPVIYKEEEKAFQKGPHLQLGKEKKKRSKDHGTTLSRLLPVMIRSEAALVPQFTAPIPAATREKKKK